MTVDVAALHGEPDTLPDFLLIVIVAFLVPLNASLLILVTPLPILIVVSVAELENAFLPIVFTLSGISRVDNLLLSNA